MRDEATAAGPHGARPALGRSTEALPGHGPLPTVSVWGAVGAAVLDLLRNPMPLVLANVVWGVVALVAWTAWLVSPSSGLLASVILAWPAAALGGVAARVVRGDRVGLGTAIRWPLSRTAVPLLALALALVALVACVDLEVAIRQGDLISVALATVAGWSLLALATLACVAWPLLGDPRRIGQGTRDLLRLTLAVALLHGPRALLASTFVGLVLVASAIMVAPLLTVSLGLVALVLCRVVLPLADRMDPIVDQAAS